MLAAAIAYRIARHLAVPGSLVTAPAPGASEASARALLDDLARDAPGLSRSVQPAGGAAAISVLTEPDEFKGSLAHLQEAAAVLAPHGIPVMRKDFLIDAYQVLEAKAAGAGGILVIVTMLTDAEVQALLAC
ncbi:MAG: indole-3-glycerol-phosphate synthase TrpC, partial [Proteobacteria bacterium]|nr:indole-3-glycerol-phosphate synthase TrpC [Pseudomonadota bacterium]